MNSSVNSGLYFHFFFLSAVALFGVTETASAQVKKCVDAQGKVTYTQNVCPKGTSKDKTIVAYTPVSNVEPSQGRDWQAEDKAFQQRQVQRDLIAASETKDRLLTKTFNDIVNKPLLPGESRTTTLKLANPEVVKTVKRECKGGGDC